MHHAADIPAAAQDLDAIDELALLVLIIIHKANDNAVSRMQLHNLSAQYNTCITSAYNKNRARLIGKLPRSMDLYML